MEEVVLSFVMVAVVVVYTDRWLRGAFEAMCKCLQIIFLTLACGNHKVNSVEIYHWLLNKTQTIAGQERGSHDVLIQNTKTYQYALNSSPIDDTGVMRSVAAFGGELRFSGYGTVTNTNF